MAARCRCLRSSRTIWRHYAGSSAVPAVPTLLACAELRGSLFEALHSATCAQLQVSAPCTALNILAWPVPACRGPQPWPGPPCCSLPSLAPRSRPLGELPPACGLQRTCRSIIGAHGSPRCLATQVGGAAAAAAAARDWPPACLPPAPLPASLNFTAQLSSCRRRLPLSSLWRLHYGAAAAARVVRWAPGRQRRIPQPTRMCIRLPCAPAGGRGARAPPLLLLCRVAALARNRPRAALAQRRPWLQLARRCGAACGGAAPRGQAGCSCCCHQLLHCATDLLCLLDCTLNRRVCVRARALQDGLPRWQGAQRAPAPGARAAVHVRRIRCCRRCRRALGWPSKPSANTE